MAELDAPSRPSRRCSPASGDPSTLETELVKASELLRCAAASAYESGDRLKGTDRDLAFSVFHLVEMARRAVDRSLAGVEIRS